MFYMYRCLVLCVCIYVMLYYVYACIDVLYVYYVVCWYVSYQLLNGANLNHKKIIET